MKTFLMKFILGCLPFVFMCCGSLVGAQEVIYQQKKLSFIDPEGDRALQSVFFATCETGVKKCMTFSNVPPQSSQLRKPRFAAENPILDRESHRTIDNRHVFASFDERKTLANLKGIIVGRKQNYPITFGAIHEWAAEGNFDVSKLFLSKPVMALATATSSRFMYVGQERSLIKWILSQKDKSVTIEKLFRKSHSLNRGNVYLTILTIENVLSDATFEKDREKTAVNQKLVDLYAKSPNKFGDWYHFFGTMLAGYIGEPAELIAKMYSMYRQISRGDLAEKSTMDADAKGALIGKELRTFVLERDVVYRDRLDKQIREMEPLSKRSLGNLKWVGPNKGGMYIGTRF